MDISTFTEIVKRTQVKEPLLFELDHDTIPQMEEILAFQDQYHIQLPEKYIYVLLNYGGGYFGYANIYSLDQESCFYLPKNNEERPEQLLFVADNECGDFYAFPVEQGKCREEVVFYDHEEQRICGTEFSDILEYLVETGLKHS